MQSAQLSLPSGQITGESSQENTSALNSSEDDKPGQDERDDGCIKHCDSKTTRTFNRLIKNLDLPECTQARKRSANLDNPPAETKSGSKSNQLERSFPSTKCARSYDRVPEGASARPSSTYAGRSLKTLREIKSMRVVSKKPECLGTLSVSSARHRPPAVYPLIERRLLPPQTDFSPSLNLSVSARSRTLVATQMDKKLSPATFGNSLASSYPNTQRTQVVPAVVQLGKRLPPLGQLQLRKWLASEKRVDAKKLPPLSRIPSLAALTNSAQAPIPDLLPRDTTAQEFKQSFPVLNKDQTPEAPYPSLENIKRSLSKDSVGRSNLADDQNRNLFTFPPTSLVLVSGKLLLNVQYAHFCQTEPDHVVSATRRFIEYASAFACVNCIGVLELSCKELTETFHSHVLPKFTLNLLAKVSVNEDIQKLIERPLLFAFHRFAQKITQTKHIQQEEKDGDEEEEQFDVVLQFAALRARAASVIQHRWRSLLLRRALAVTRKLKKAVSTLSTLRARAAAKKAIAATQRAEFVKLKEHVLSSRSKILFNVDLTQTSAYGTLNTQSISPNFHLRPTVVVHLPSLWISPHARKIVSGVRDIEAMHVGRIASLLTDRTQMILVVPQEEADFLLRVAKAFLARTTRNQHAITKFTAIFPESEPQVPKSSPLSFALYVSPQATQLLSKALKDGSSSPGSYNNSKSSTTSTSSGGFKDNYGISGSTRDPALVRLNSFVASMYDVILSASIRSTLVSELPEELTRFQRITRDLKTPETACKSYSVPPFSSFKTADMALASALSENPKVGYWFLKPHGIIGTKRGSAVLLPKRLPAPLDKVSLLSWATEWPGCLAYMDPQYTRDKVDYVYLLCFTGFSIESGLAEYDADFLDRVEIGVHLDFDTLNGTCTIVSTWETYNIDIDAAASVTVAPHCFVPPETLVTKMRKLIPEIGKNFVAGPVCLTFVSSFRKLGLAYESFMHMYATLGAKEFGSFSAPLEFEDPVFSLLTLDSILPFWTQEAASMGMCKIILDAKLEYPRITIASGAIIRPPKTAVSTPSPPGSAQTTPSSSAPGSAAQTYRSSSSSAAFPQFGNLVSSLANLRPLCVTTALSHARWLDSRKLEDLEKEYLRKVEVYGLDEPRVAVIMSGLQHYMLHDCAAANFVLDTRACAIDHMLRSGALFMPLPGPSLVAFARNLKATLRKALWAAAAFGIHCGEPDLLPNKSNICALGTKMADFARAVSSLHTDTGLCNSTLDEGSQTADGKKASDEHNFDFAQLLEAARDLINKATPAAGQNDEVVKGEGEKNNDGEKNEDTFRLFVLRAEMDEIEHHTLEMTEVAKQMTRLGNTIEHAVTEVEDKFGIACAAMKDVQENSDVNLLAGASSPLY